MHVRAGHTTATSRPEYRRGYLTTLSDRVRQLAERADAPREVIAGIRPEHFEDARLMDAQAGEAGQRLSGERLDDLDGGDLG